jgi:hypothetical protein
VGVIRAQPQLVLAQTAVNTGAAAHTGDTNETTLASITLPANTLGLNGRLRIIADFSHTGSAGTFTPKTKFGGTGILTASYGSGVASVRHCVDIVNRNSASSQFVHADAVSSAAAWSVSNTTLAIDTTADATILLTGTLGNSGDTVTLEAYQIILYPKG